MMTALSIDLLRILAGSGRIELIRTLRAFPERDFTINELARTAVVPTMTTWRAIRELRSAGIVRTRKVGKATAVSLTEDREKLRTLRLVPETDPQRSAARLFASEMARHPWTIEFRLFGTVARGEHLPGEEVDVAVVYDQEAVGREEAEASANEVSTLVRERTNVTIVPLCVEKKEMTRKGGLAAELRDKESLWRRERDQASAPEI